MRLPGRGGDLLSLSRHSRGRSDTGKNTACWSACCTVGPGRAVTSALAAVWYVVDPAVSAVVEADGYCGGLACCAASPTCAVICAWPGVWYKVEPPMSVPLSF